MAKSCSKNNLAHRTSHSFEYCIYIFVFACAIVTSDVGAHIDFDDIELAWLKNVTVKWLPMEKNQPQNWLQIVGLPPMDNEDDLKIRPTFSATDCVSDETNLQILKSIPTANNRSTELIVSLGNFDFKHQSTAYLCIQTKYETFFQHMGNRSKVENPGVDLFNRDRRNPQFETTHSDSLCPMGVLRIIGIRIVSSDKEYTTDDEDIPDLVAKYNARLRLYGCGFQEQTVITFTKKVGGSCQEDLGQYQVIANGLREDTALVDIMVPAADVNKYYICIRNMGSEMEEKKNEQAPIFKHQGADPWRCIRSHDLILPDWLSIIIICLCLILSALFSGLNLGLMSLDRTELKILRNTGNPNERKYAKKIQPVRDHGNYLLCSILLGNVMVNSILTILLGNLTTGLVAVLGSTLLIVIFGEISPQAICSRHGLAVGAKTIVITKAIMVLTFPLAYPVSKILDCILGEEIGNVYDRERLKELVRVTKDTNDLDKDEVNIISGALELRKKTVKAVMTPIEDAYMLSMDAILDFNTVTDIMRSGFSRIPVYEGNRNNVVTLLFIKDLALIDTDDKTPLRTVCTFYENACFFVFEDLTLDVIFKDFKAGRKGHMAFVHHINTEGDGDPFYETIGLVTLEDVIEEMIQAEIIDETDVYTDNRNKKKRSSRDRDKVYKVFRGSHQREPISQQLALATYQYLNTTVDGFKTDKISKIILRHLLNQNVFHLLKMKSKDKTDKSNYLYEHGKPADYFVLILEGRVEVMVGKENLLFEGGAFTYYGTQALTDNVGIVVQVPNRTPDKSPNRSQNGSMNSLFKDVIVEYAFVPDFTVRALTDLSYVLIKRSRYLAAKRATSKLEELNAGNVSNEPIDDEVKELLFSFDEGDGSESAHSPNLNATSRRHSASTIASPTNAHVESPLRTATHQGEHHQCSTPVVIYAPENHTVQIHTPERESQETDALLTPQS